MLGNPIKNSSKLQILPNGISYKQEFKLFTDKQKLYSLQVTASFQDLQAQFVKLCANSHDLFKHLHPLWKNSNFFIKLPFKMNEDVNPTKATHAGMTPSDLILAREECAQLLTQGLIEPTTSNWASH